MPPPPTSTTGDLLADLAADMRVLKATLEHVDKKLDRTVYRDVYALEQAQLVKRIEALEQSDADAVEDREDSRRQRGRLFLGFLLSAVLAAAPYLDDLLRLIVSPPR